MKCNVDPPPWDPDVELVRSRNCTTVCYYYRSSVDNSESVNNPFDPLRSLGKNR